MQRAAFGALLLISISRSPEAEAMLARYFLRIPFMETKTPRLFILIVGQLRSAEQTIGSFREYCVGLPEAKIVVQCGAAERAMAEKCFPGALIDAWDPPDPMPWRVRWAWPLFGEAGRECGRCKPSFYYQLLRQYRALYLCAGQLDVGRDWILKWRPDLRLFGPLDWRRHSEERVILLPPNDNFGGYNDQWALGPADLMATYLNRIERLGDYFAVGGRVQPEAFLKWCLAGMPVGRWSVPYCMDRGTHLQPVIFCKAWDDVLNDEWVAGFGEAGVPINTEERDPLCPHVLFPECGRFGKHWQRVLSWGWRPDNERALTKADVV